MLVDKEYSRGQNFKMFYAVCLNFPDDLMMIWKRKAYLPPRGQGLISFKLP